MISIAAFRAFKVSEENIDGKRDEKAQVKSPGPFLKLFKIFLI